MIFKWQQTDKQTESGNILLTLFAAVAVIGTIGASATVLMRGPLSTMSDVNQSTMTEGHIYTAAKMVLLDVEALGSSDCDSDRVVEPRPWRTHADTPPTGGGFIPNEIGSVKRDTWGTQIGYCAWNHGSVNTGGGCDATNLLTGTNKRDYPTVAIISAGPNGSFESTCAAYVDTTPADGEADTPLFTPGGDDIYVVYSYAEAAQELPTLWKVDSPDIWSIEVDVTAGPEVVAKDKVEFTGNDVFAPTKMEMLGQHGLVIPDENTLTTCGASTYGQLRRNMSGASPVLEICDNDTGTFESISGAATGESGSGSGAGTDVGSNTTATILGPTSGLVGYWRLDETSGTDTYDSIGTVHGALEGSMDASTDSVSGVYDNAFDFDGTDDYIDLGDNHDFIGTAAYTLSAWVYPQSVGDYRRIVAKESMSGGREGYSLYLHDGSDSQPTLGVACERWENNTFLNSARNTSGPLADDTWHHLTCTYDGSDIKLYLNGILISTNSTAADIIDNDGLLTIGGDETGSELSGYIDDVRIYDRALSDSEVEELYNHTNYIARVNVEQPSVQAAAINTSGWATTLASDAQGDAAGIAFIISRDYSLSDAPSAAITASRESAPSRAHIAFQTFDGTSLENRMIATIDNKGFVLDDNAHVTQEARIQVGEHFDDWNDSYDRGMLFTSNDASTQNQLAYFGDHNSDDATTLLLFSNMLKLQRANQTGTTITEYMRFESTPQISVFGDIETVYDSSQTGIRLQRYSNTASNFSTYDFIRNRNGDAVADSDIVGSLVFKGYAGGFVDGANAAVRGVVNGTVSSGDVPVDLVFGTSATGDALSQEGLRITSAGDVGVGRASPEAKFHVAGRLVTDEGIKIGRDTTCAGAVDSGTLSYDSGAYELCDGSTQSAVVGSSGGGVSVCKPIPFNFLDRDDLVESAVYETNTIMIGGLVGSCTLTVSSDSTSMTIVKNGGDQSGTIVTVSNGDTISIKMTAINYEARFVKATVSLGNYSDEVKFYSAGKLAFLGNTTTNANLGGVDGADQLCQEWADAAGFEGRIFFAWVAGDDDSTSPAVRFRKYTGPYYTSDGVSIADDWDDLTDGSLDNELDWNEYAAISGGKLAWTNVDTDGSSLGSDSCNEWTSENGADIGATGDAAYNDGNWTDNSNTDLCSDARKLYCIEQ